MKNFLTFITLAFCILQANAQIPLKGVVTVQNSKTKTGTTEYVSNAQVECDKKAQPKTSDSKGEFMLQIVGKQNEQIAVFVIPKGKYENYVVVNEREIKDLTLGRVTPVSVYVCLKGELEQRQAEMVGINMQKLEERLEKEKKRLQKELNELKAKNDYLNVRYRQVKDSLDIIEKSIDNAFEQIMEYAKNLVLENLDDHDEGYVKAYKCFSRGELDSVSYYLRNDDLDKQYEKALQMQEEAKKEKELAAILTVSAKAKEEVSENHINELIKSWLLLANTADMQNDYEKAKANYEKAISADTTNAKNILEYANYLHKIREYTNAEKQYLRCLEIYRALGRDNPKAHLQYLAITLNNLAVLHKTLNEHSVSFKEYEEALAIRKKLAVESPETHSQDVAATLNNLANLHLDTKEYQKALSEYEEALKIYRKLAVEKPSAYLPHVATILNNLAMLHKTLNEHNKALKEYEEALAIRKKIAAENPKAYLLYVATTLRNLANLHSDTKDYAKALEEYEEALQILKKLVVENPKVYLPDMVMTLTNLGTLHSGVKEYSKASEEFKGALEIYSELVEENPKAYLPYLTATLNKLYDAYSNLKDYSAAIKHLNIWNDLLLKYQKQIDNYKTELEKNYNRLSWNYLFTKEFAKSEQSARKSLEFGRVQAKVNLAHALLFQNRFSEAEKIYKELSQTVYKNNETYTKTLLDDLNTLEAAAVIPEKCKTDVEKIRGMLKK